MPEPRSKGHLNPGDAGVAFDRFELGAGGGPGGGAASDGGGPGEGAAGGGGPGAGAASGGGGGASGGGGPGGRVREVGPAHGGAAGGRGFGALVRHVWVVRWALPDGEARPQRVLGYPAVNVVLQRGGAVFAGPDPRLSVQTLSGAGWAVGVLFRPAAARILSPLEPEELVGREVAFEGAPLAAVTAAMEEAGPTVARQRLVGVLRAWLAPATAAVGERGRLVNAVCRLAEEESGIVRVDELAERAGLGVRALERLVREQVGVSPKWLIECRRLQEVATRLHAHPETELSGLAAELGYADYPHFSRRYARFLGETPEATRRSGAGAGGAVEKGE